jgi:hypothetical protein
MICPRGSLGILQTAISAERTYGIFPTKTRQFDASVHDFAGVSSLWGGCQKSRTGQPNDGIAKGQMGKQSAWDSYSI